MAYLRTYPTKLPLCNPLITFGGLTKIVLQLIIKWKQKAPVTKETLSRVFIQLIFLSSQSYTELFALCIHFINKMFDYWIANITY